MYVAGFVCDVLKTVRQTVANKCLGNEGIDKSVAEYYVCGSESQPFFSHCYRSRFTKDSSSDAVLLATNQSHISKEIRSFRGTHELDATSGEHSIEEFWRWPSCRKAVGFLEHMFGGRHAFRRPQGISVVDGLAAPWSYPVGYLEKNGIFKQMVRFLDEFRALFCTRRRFEEGSSFDVFTSRSEDCLRWRFGEGSSCDVFTPGTGSCVCPIDRMLGTAYVHVLYVMMRYLAIGTRQVLLPAALRSVAWYGYNQRDSLC